MRNAALILGVIGGIWALIIGFFIFGYTVFIDEFGEFDGMAHQVERLGLVRTVAFLAPLLAIAGGGMARARALWGGVLLLVSAGMMLYAFDFGVFTMFPIGMTGLAGLMAIAAGRPDEPKAHF
ncbi:MAG: hypothetical protein RID23_09665 [Roseovarius sp.]